MPHPKLTEVFNRVIDLLDIQPAYYQYRNGRINPETKERAIWVLAPEERQGMLCEVRNAGGEFYAATFTPLLRVALLEDEIWATNTNLSSVNQLVFTLRLPRAKAPEPAGHRDFEDPDAMVEEILAYIARR